MLKLKPHAKAVAAALVAVAYALILAFQTSVQHDGFQATDLFPVTAAVGAAVLVWLVPVLPEYPHLKTLVSGFLSAVAAVGVLYQNTGVTPNVMAVVVAVLGTLAVHHAPYEPATTSAQNQGE